METIRELRKFVGHAPLVLTGACIFLLDEENRVLLLQRSDNACWGPPGGALEPGESLEDTARRETVEESGLKVEDLELFGVFSGPDLFYTYPNGDQVHNVTVAFIARAYQGEIQLSEHTSYGWFGMKNLPQPISPPIIPVLKAFVEHILHSKG